MSLQHSFQRVGRAEDVIRLSRANPEQAKRTLQSIIKEAEQTNKGWIEWVFGELRKSNPFTDVVMLGEDGRVEGNWATLADYAKMKVPPKIEDILSQVNTEGRLRYMATPKKSSMIFYFQEHEDKLLTLLNFEPHPYLELQIVGHRMKIHMAYVERIKPGDENPLGQGALKFKHLALGKLGYWAQSDRKKQRKGSGIGFLTPEKEESVVTRYILRVYINKHPMRGFVYLTPLQMPDLLQEGMLPMDRAMDGMSPITRIEVQPATEDTITNFLLAYMSDASVNNFPLVLRHDSYRPWEGDFPKHGGRQQYKK